MKSPHKPEKSGTWIRKKFSSLYRKTEEYLIKQRCHDVRKKIQRAEWCFWCYQIDIQLNNKMSAFSLVAHHVTSGIKWYWSGLSLEECFHLTITVKWDHEHIKSHILDECRCRVIRAFRHQICQFTQSVNIVAVFWRERGKSKLLAFHLPESSCWFSNLLIVAIDFGQVCRQNQMILGVSRAEFQHIWSNLIPYFPGNIPALLSQMKRGIIFSTWIDFKADCLFWDVWRFKSVAQMTRFKKTFTINGDWFWMTRNVFALDNESAFDLLTWQEPIYILCPLSLFLQKLTRIGEQIISIDIKGDNEQFWGFKGALLIRYCLTGDLFNRSICSFP